MDTTDEPQAANWQLPENTQQLQFDAWKTGLTSAIVAYPHFVDTVRLDAQLVATLVIMREQHQGALTNDFSLFSSIFIQWHKEGYVAGSHYLEENPTNAEMLHTALAAMNEQQMVDWLAEFAQLLIDARHYKEKYGWL
jgi:hypothetical protein